MHSAPSMCQFEPVVLIPLSTAFCPPMWTAPRFLPIPKENFSSDRRIPRQLGPIGPKARPVIKVILAPVRLNCFYGLGRRYPPERSERKSVVAGNRRDLG